MFHGKKDTVISYKQTLKIQEILIQNNKYSEVIFFDNEGHGFRNIQNILNIIFIWINFIFSLIKTLVIY